MKTLTSSVSPASWLTIACFLFVLPLQGQVVTQTSTMTGDQNWNDSQFWSDELPPSAAKDYVTGGTLTIRSPHGTGAAVFGGNSLTLQDTADFFIRKNAISNPVTVDRLIINTGATGPQIKNAAGGVAVLNGTIEVNGNGSFRLDAERAISEGNPRILQINSRITAESTVESIVIRSSQGAQNGIGEVLITHSDNVFSGTWVVQQYGVLRGTTAGSLAQGNFLVQGGGLLDFDYDFSHATSSLVLNGILQLDQDLTFGSVSIGGASLDAGTYSFDQLSSTYEGYFLGASGIGSITVIPEPSEMSLALGMGLLTCLLIRRYRSRV